MKKTLSFVLLLAIIVFFASCKKSSNKKLPLNEMKTIMWDMVCADELYAESVAKDSTLKIKKDNFRLYEQVFAAHKISKEDFYSSLHYYQSHTDEFKVLVDSLQNYSIQQKNKPATIKPSLPKKVAQ